MRQRWIGLDVGGANLKRATSDGDVQSRPFALWQRREQLPAALGQLLEGAPPEAPLAVTMTGELADCYRDRAEGVRHILASVTAVAGGRPVRVYRIGGGFITPEAACAAPEAVAAGNWHALALWLARMADAPGVLVDVGSTTADVIPLAPGRVATGARTDQERLNTGQLLYFGAQRTPVCALVDHLPYRGQQVPVMAERFATTDDCALLLGKVDEAPEDDDSADGRPRTAREAANRMAKMIGLDDRTVAPGEARVMAAAVLSAMRDRLAAAIGRQAALLPAADGGGTLWLSGHGSWMVPLGGGPLAARRLADRIGDDAARAAPALAVALLAAEESPCGAGS